MINSRTPSTADLLLQLLEAVALGSTPLEQAVREVEQAFGRSNLSRRVSQSIAILVAEGLVASRADTGRILYGATPLGLRTLERQGRFTHGATVLFTDIVGSTQLIDAHGEIGANELRQRHFALLRDAIAVHGGREVKSLGDGLMVVFADAAEASACAAAMQWSVAADADGLGLRVGLHSGELLREDDDFYGSTVIIARRLCDLADSGQIIISDDTRALTEASREEEVESLGRLTLKGLSDPVAAFTLWWRERPSDPALAGA